MKHISSEDIIYVYLFHKSSKANIIKKLLKLNFKNVAAYILDEKPLLFTKIFKNFKIVKGVYSSSDELVIAVKKIIGPFEV